MTTPLTEPTAPGTVPAQTAPAGTAPPGTDPASTAPAASVGPIEPEAVAALQQALAAEHAAIWTYGYIGAFDKDQLDVNRIATYTQQHVVTRDGSIDLITGVAGTPVRTEVAYALPVEVTDDPSTSRALAAVIESDCTKGWRFVIGSTDNAFLRDFAVAALSDSAVRQTAWKLVDPAVTPNPLVPFPGASTP